MVRNNENQNNQRLPHLRITADNIAQRPIERPGRSTVYQRSDYRSHGQSLRENIETVVQSVSNKVDTNIINRYYFQVRIASDEKLKNRHRSLLNDSRIKILDVIDESTGYAVIRTQDLEILRNKLDQYINTENHRGKSYLSFLEEFNDISYQEKIYPDLQNLMEEDGNRTLKVTIESFSDLPPESSLELLYTELKRCIINNQRETFQGFYTSHNGSIVIEGELLPQTIEQLAQNFNSIRSIEPTPNIIFTNRDSEISPMQDIGIDELKGNAIVCIFDTGINHQDTLLNQFIHDSIDEVIAHNYNTEHGSFVASRIIFRDNIEEQLSSGLLQPRAKVLDVRIFGLDGTGIEINLSERELTSAIRRTVVRFHEQIKVYNLSIGFVDMRTDATTLNDRQVSRLAEELDYLSKKYGVLFVISAGNIRRAIDPYTYPDHFESDSTRILPPSEAFLGLSVGSLAHKNINGALGDLEHPSPFSRRGPGFGETRKPDLVANGGNILRDGTSSDVIKVAAINEQGIVYNNGTSFAAPIVSSYAAELFDVFPGISPNLVKALLIHFSDISPNTYIYPRYIFDHVGFGMPNIEHCLESLSTKATYVHEGTLEPKTYYTIPFWIPSILTNRSGRKKLRVRITIVWNPLVDRLKGEDYSLIHIYPNLYKKTNGTDLQKVPMNLSSLNDICYKKNYYPIARLEKEFDRNIDSGLWQLELRMSHRWNIPEDYQQNFAVVISVEDPHDELPVYENIIQEVGIRYPVFSQVRV
ncbi:S8 family peptidase [Priestia megaterium]